MESKKASNTTVAFNIAIFIFFIVFVIVLNNPTFNENKNFIQLVGITIGCSIVGGILFLISTSLIDALLKIIVEVAIAFLLFVNVSTIAISWSSFDKIKMYISTVELNLVQENVGVASALSIVLTLLIIDIIASLILVPLTRIVGTNILD